MVTLRTMCRFFHVYRSVNSPFCLGVEPPPKFLKPPPLLKPWGLTGSQFLDGVAGKEGVTFFRGGVAGFT